MRIGQFGVLIPEGREYGTGHVALAHGQTYTLQLQNLSRRRCDVFIEVDGKSVGDFQLRANTTAKLERPLHEAKLFTFYRSDSSEGHEIGLAKVSGDDLGLVRVRFRPERVRPPMPRLGHLKVRHMVEYSGGGPMGQSVGGGQMTNSVSPKGLSSGGTGLSGRSDQTFDSVDLITDYDPSEEVTISLRLVADNGYSGERPYELTPAPRGNPIPPPV